MSMTRTDYQILAQGIRSEYKNLMENTSQRESLEVYKKGYIDAIGQVIDTLNTNYPNFNKDKFYEWIKS